MESDWPRRNKIHYVTEIVSWLEFADIIFGGDRQEQEIHLCSQAKPTWEGGGNPHLKRSGTLIISLRGINQGFWSHLGYS